MILTILLILAFFGVMIGVGIYCRRHATDVNGFVLGGRSVGPWLTAFAFGTSYFSAVIFVGYAGQFGWNFGLASTWIGLGNAFIGSLLAWEVLGRRTRIMTQQLDSKTMPDFFGKRYKSPALKIFASVIVFIFLIPYTASLYNGLSSLFEMAFNVPYFAVIIVMAALTAVYVIFGGYMATAINDFIQGIIMLGGIVAVIAAVLIRNGGFTSAITKLSLIDAGTGAQGTFTSFFGADPLSLLFVIILTSLGTWGLPQMVGKFYAIKDEGSIKKGTVISTIFAIVVAGGCYFLGGFGRLYADKIPLADGKISFDSIIPTMLSEMPSVIIAVVIVLVLAASMSTLSSLVLTSSSTLTLDVIFKENKDGKADTEKQSRKKLFVMRVFILFFIAVSAAIAIIKDMYGFTFIAQMMGVSWGALAGAFLAPFLFSLYSKRTTKLSVVVCFIVGCSIECFQLFYSLSSFRFADGTFLNYIFASSIRSGSVAMLLGVIIIPLLSIIKPKKNREFTDKLFDAFNTEVNAPAKEYLK